MKSIVTFSSHSIKIQTPIRVFFFISVIGAFLGAAGIFKLGEIYPFDHALIGTGIVVVHFGLYYLLKSKYYKILINEDPGYLSLVESTGWGISPLKIPYKYFTEIVVQYIVNKNTPEYGVLLKNRVGALLLIAKFHRRDRAIEFTDRFEKTIGLPVKENTEIPFDLIDRKHPYNPYGIVLPDKTSLEIKEQRDTREIIWKTRLYPFQMLYLLAIYYGFVHIIHFAVISYFQISVTIAMVIYTFLGVILSLVLAAIAANFFGTHHVHINREYFFYFRKVFGIKVVKMEMKKSDIMLIRSSIDFSNEDMIIASGKGIEGVNSITRKFNPAIKDITKAEVGAKEKHIFKDELIKLNETNLKLAEKLYIEQFILKSL